MPISKEKKAERLALGQCSLCTRERAVKSDGERSQYCDEHLRYFRRYRKNWIAENADLKQNRCSNCRETGHTVKTCPMVRPRH